MKNPYRKELHRQAFDECLMYINKWLLGYLEAARLLDPEIPREKRKQIAAKAARLLREEQDANIPNR